MRISGSYGNYVTMSSLLAPLGVRDSGNVVMQVFSSALSSLQDKIDRRIFSEESEAALTQLYQDIANLDSTAKRLTSTDMDSVFNDRTASSSDPNVLTATAVDAFSSDSGANEATYGISVTQLAQAQENTGLELNATDASVVNVGTNSFNVHINGQDHELSFEVVEGDTNEDVLVKMAEAITNADIGLSAEVADGVAEGTKKLVVTSDETGTPSAYALSDLSGNAVTATGADTVSTSAQDAVYEVDGTEYSSSTNRIYLDDGLVTVNLQGVGESTLTVAPDAEMVQNTLSDFVSGLNSLIDLLGDNEDYIQDEVLVSVNGFVNAHNSALESLGITRGDDEILEVDTDKLAEAVSQNLSAIKETFGGFDGLAMQIDGYASHLAMDSPLSYAKEADNMPMAFADYLYGASAQRLQYMFQGSLLDNYI